MASQERRIHAAASGSLFIDPVAPGVPMRDVHRDTMATPHQNRSSGAVTLTNIECIEANSVA
jgi:hypothetical protein